MIPLFHYYFTDRTDSGCGDRSRRCIQQGPVQAADGPGHAVCSQLNNDPVDFRSAPGENSGCMQLGNWSSALHLFRMGLPQGSPLSPVLFYVYTKGLANLNQNGPSKILTLADDGLI